MFDNDLSLPEINNLKIEEDDGEVFMFTDKFKRDNISTAGPSID